MLSILDKYIVRKFLSTFFFMLTIIMLFAMVFDVSEKLSEFISNKAPVHAIIFEYYFSFFLFHGNMFSSMIVFISVIWFTAKLAQDTELIPMFYSGKPMLRFLRPYMLSATVLMVLSLLLNHFIVPNANKLRLGFEEKYYRDVMTVQDYHADYPNNTTVYFSNYTNDEGKVSNLIVQRWDSLGKPVFFLKANTAENIPNTYRWKLNHVYLKQLQFPKGTLRQVRSMDTVFNFSIQEMAQRENVAETMTSLELSQMISKEKNKGSSRVPFYEIELHQRTSYPFATYILTLIGFSVSSQKRRGGIGMSIAIGLAFVFVYIFSMKIMAVSALNLGIPAVIAVWIPNLLFGVTSIVLYRHALR
ncbi:MAG: YjgP/YjgQ family permease [Bacteroidetes bacterium]|nr:YjgP/YjgQ family permease [Bacteroidota bacterium]